MIHVPPQIPVTLPVRIAFLGEAPSDEEVSQCRPFVGPDGRILNAMFRAAELDREVFHITNAFDQQAPDNDCTEWMKDPIRVEENAARLAEEFALTKPNIIVPLGGTALWMLTGHKGISQFRGAVYKADRVVPGAKLLPTYHPGAVRQQWRLLPLVVGDIIKANKEGRTAGFHYPKRTLLIEPSLSDIRAFKRDCLASNLLSTDIETGWGQITCIAFAPTAELAMCIPFVDLRKPGRSYWPTATAERDAWLEVKELCESPVPKVGQNFTYDIQWLMRLKGIAVRNYRYDTRLQHKVMYPELPADLASMAASYTRIGAYKQWGGHYQKEEKKDG